MLQKDVPWFDERFRGSDGGRVAQAADMARHLSFAVHRSAFAVRVPCFMPEQALSAAEAIYDQVMKLLPNHASACAHSKTSYFKMTVLHKQSLSAGRY